TFERTGERVCSIRRVIELQAMIKRESAFQIKDSSCAVALPVSVDQPQHGRCNRILLIDLASLEQVGLGLVLFIEGVAGNTALSQRRRIVRFSFQYLVEDLDGLSERLLLSPREKISLAFNPGSPQQAGALPYQYLYRQLSNLRVRCDGLDGSVASGH